MTATQQKKIIYLKKKSWKFDLIVEPGKATRVSRDLSRPPGINIMKKIPLLAATVKFVCKKIVKNDNLFFEDIPKSSMKNYQECVIALIKKNKLSSWQAYIHTYLRFATKTALPTKIILCLCLECLLWKECDSYKKFFSSCKKTAKNLAKDLKISTWLRENAKNELGPWKKANKVSSLGFHFLGVIHWWRQISSNLLYKFEVASFMWLHLDHFEPNLSWFLITKLNTRCSLGASKCWWSGFESKHFLVITWEVVQGLSASADQATAGVEPTTSRTGGNPANHFATALYEVRFIPFSSSSSYKWSQLTPFHVQPTFFCPASSKASAEIFVDTQFLPDWRSLCHLQPVWAALAELLLPALSKFGEAWV